MKSLTGDQLLALAIVGLMVTAVAAGVVVYYSVDISGRGIIAALGMNIYSDPLGQFEISAIDWGTVYPGGLYNATLWFQSDPEVTTVPGNLTMEVVNWLPEGIDLFMSVTWDLENYELDVAEMKKGIVQLSIDPAISGFKEFTNTMIFTIYSEEQYSGPGYEVPEA